MEYFFQNFVMFYKKNILQARGDIKGTVTSGWSHLTTLGNTTRVKYMKEIIAWLESIPDLKSGVAGDDQSDKTKYTDNFERGITALTSASIY